MTGKDKVMAFLTKGGRILVPKGDIRRIAAAGSYERARASLWRTCSALLLLNYRARDTIARVARRLASIIVGFGMNDDRRTISTK